MCIRDSSDITPGARVAGVATAKTDWAERPSAKAAIDIENAAAAKQGYDRIAYKQRVRLAGASGALPRAPQQQQQQQQNNASDIGRGHVTHSPDRQTDRQTVQPAISGPRSPARVTSTSRPGPLDSTPLPTLGKGVWRATE